jgi:hypothetical protein
MDSKFEYVRDGMDEIDGIESVGLVDEVGLLAATGSGSGKLCLGCRYTGRCHYFWQERSYTYIREY